VLASKGVPAWFSERLEAILSGDALAVVTKAASDSPDAVAMTQAIHDASVHIGAQCVIAPMDDYDDGADDGANKAAALRLRLKALSR
jgi:hypothetical protein